ncbi:MAG: kinase [Candidatus Roseilinea sp.]|nr:MAG: kinase [Candidatus Roseilinea sp.]
MSQRPDQRSLDVLCAGILVADVFIPPLPHLPRAGELMATGDFLTDSGGCAANVATCLAKLGVSVGVAGKVGDDLFGEFIRRDLALKHVDVTGIKCSAMHGTSKTVILPVTGEDRRYVHTFGANADFRASDVDRDQLTRSRVFYLGGYLVLPELDQTSLSELFHLARAHGAQTVLDVVVPAGSPASLDLLADVLPHVDYFLPNDEEAEQLTGEGEPHRQAQRFLDAGCGTAVITLGHRGVLLMNRQQTIRASAFAVDVIDASGAGDAFAGGLIAGLLEGWDVVRIVRFASAIGASACTALGCNAGLFTRAQADAFMNTHRLEITAIH